LSLFENKITPQNEMYNSEKKYVDGILRKKNLYQENLQKNTSSQLQKPIQYKVIEV
jgi:hypothetical protein